MNIDGIEQYEALYMSTQPQTPIARPVANPARDMPLATPLEFSATLRAERQPEQVRAQAARQRRCRALRLSSGMTK